MELYFRKYLWTATAAFVLVSANFAARIVNTLVGAQLAPAAASLVAPAPGLVAHAPVDAHPALDGPRVASLFGVKWPEPPAETPVAAAPMDDLSSEPVKTSLRAMLIGTIVAVPTDFSLAVIQNDEIKETSVYGIGDRLMNVAVVLSIDRGRVVVMNESEHRREYLDDTPGTGLVNLATTAMPPPGGPLNPGGIKELAPNNYKVPRSELDNAIANMSDLATKARIVPSFKNGVANGFKLFSIVPDSLYAKIGIQNGDVVRRINGYDINSPEKALEIYQKLQTANHVDVEVERRGETVKKSYSIE